MKAELHTLNGVPEIRLETGETIKARPDEDATTLKERVTLYVSDQYIERLDLDETKVKRKRRPLPKRPTESEVIELRKRKGERVTFTPFRKDYQVTGTIRQVYVDNRVNLAYFRIWDDEDKLYLVRCDRV